jgi:lipoate---protein ligase
LMAWVVEHLSGTVRELHERSAALLAGTGEMGRVARVLQPVDQAVVLGSTQALTSVDHDACARAGVDIVRRRSGGGAVLVDATSLFWVDLVVPAGDPLWSPDVGRAAWWVGKAWSEALSRAGTGGTEVWKGPLVRNRWSSLVCFAGLGAGEVVSVAGKKVVGVSQRRTRHGALFQCGCVLEWSPQRLLGLLALTPDERAAALAELGEAALGAGVERAEALEAALVSVLP